jgi:AcrR family transcriptional regulator
MARKATRSKARRSAAKAIPTGSPRERIVTAFMTLLGERPIERIGFAEIAEQAGVSLADLRGEFSSGLAILATHVKELDRQVLSDIDPEMEEEPPRERLFDVLMRRLELLAPHREAVRSLLRSARRDPPLALALDGLAVRSQQWMLTAAGIDASGPKGMVRAKAGAIVRQRAAHWVDDNDRARPAPRALDREARPRPASRACRRACASRPPARSGSGCAAPAAIAARAAGATRTTIGSRPERWRASR